MKRLYLDVDGVLLTKVGDGMVLAPYARQFIDFALANFDCYWLTTRCGGVSGDVLRDLAGFVPAELLKRMGTIKPTTFDVLKTESLTGDFYWIDDNPLPAEMTDLCRRKAFDRWIKINTRVNSDDLLRAIELLQSVLSKSNTRHTVFAPENVGVVAQIA